MHSLLKKALIGVLAIIAILFITENFEKMYLTMSGNVIREETLQPITPFISYLSWVLIALIFMYMAYMITSEIRKNKKQKEILFDEDEKLIQNVIEQSNKEN